MNANFSVEKLPTSPITPPNPMGELERVTYRAVLRQNKVPNVHAQAELIYDVLFNPAAVDESIFVNDNNHADSDLQKISMARSALVDQDNLPNRDTFITTFCREVTHTNISEAVFPGSIKAIQKLVSGGMVCIWTSGDTHGSSSSAGSAEQYKRIVKAGLSPSNFPDQRDNIFAHSHEDKINTLEGTIARFIAGGVKHLLIVDDRIINLINAREFITTHFPTDFPADAITLVWDQESIVGKSADSLSTSKGMGGDPATEAFDNGVHVVTSITDVPTIVEGQPNLGTLIDLDDVLISESQTVDLRMKAVSNLFYSQGWLKNSPPPSVLS